MSSPLSSLGKNKKPPLFLPEMSSPTPTPKEPEKSFRIPFNSGYTQIPTKTSQSSLSTHENLLPIIRKNSIETPRIPLNYVPFKTNIDDSDLIDEVTTQMAVTNIKRNLPLNKSNALSSTPNDMELMQIMMSKIKQTEKRCAILEKESHEKDKKIQVLEEKLHLFKKVQSQSRDEIIDELEEKNLKLLNQISEMEAFLQDYGLRWIGSQNESRDIEKNNSISDSRINNDLSNFKIDYDLIKKNVAELNSLVETNETKIVEFNENKVKFEQSDSIKLTLYSNGIALFNGPFRPIEDSLTKKFCIDIMDGYFPTELQEKYPDGIRFDLVDKRDIFYKEEKNSVFKSKGYRLGSARQENNENLDKFTNTNESDFHFKQDEFDKKIETQLAENPLTIDQFLNKLPNNIIKDGKIINIRSDLSNLIKGADPSSKSSNLISYESSINNNLVDNSIKAANNDNSSKIATLKIKSLTNGDNTFIVKLKYTDTIQNLKDHIKAHKKFKSVDRNFDIASVYPRKIFDNLKMTLEECDLVPNSNIMLIPKKNRY